MPAQRKPEEIVPILLARLEKAKQFVVGSISENSEGDPLVLKFKEIEIELGSMKRLFPRIKHWEGKLMEQFRTLEQDIDDDVFFKQHDEANEILNRLKRISESVVSVKQLFSAVERQLMDRTRTMPSSGMQFPSEEAFRKDQTISEEWLRLGVEEKIYASKAISNFQKSFDCLESYQLKACSLCLSIFPENSIIKKRPLIYWWIGEGMNLSPNINTFIVHPWIRRMLILVAKRLSFFEFTPSGMPSNGHRRAFLLAGGSDSYSTMTEDTLMVFNVNDQYLGFKPDWLSKLNRVEVLQLGRWQNSVKHHIEVENKDLTVESKKKKKVEYEVSLDGLGSQTSLRYLSLRGVSRLTNLPPSVLNLISLEILDLRACHNLEKLPSDISALRNLTHLDLSECYLLECMPKGIEELSALQVLKGFVIGIVRRNPCRVSDLAQLKGLRKLSIRIGNEALTEGEFSNLKDFTALQILVISWGIVLSQSSTNAALSPFSVPPKLKKLDLRCIPIVTWPEWLGPGRLISLEKLYIRGGELKSLKYQGEQTWKVKILRLKYLKNLKIDVQELKTMFPKVEYLEKQLLESQTAPVSPCAKCLPGVI
ncbi:unnamed protein product [Coffea canephora]|uniref:Disease resistance R13L4/SHOC-2-like LRR domain-containing protein n=1 Tax=Coffea canephora TaxID=49390 RepID=A0A068UHG7_COFCA|nr:unnamed protein product [Coffea canephora]